MKFHYHYYFILIIVCFFLSCKKDNPVESFEVGNYPLKTGNTWTYSKKIYNYNFRPTQPGTSFPLDTLNGSGTIETMGKVLLHDSVETWKFHNVERSSETGYVYEGDEFYIYRNDSLIRYAYTYESLFAPKSLLKYKYKFQGILYDSPREIFKTLEDNIITSKTATFDTTFESSRVVSFVFPLQIGKEWDFLPNDSPFFRVHKKVNTIEVLTLPQGGSQVYKVQFFWDTDRDGFWDSNINGYDYVGQVGLIKREFYFYNLIVTTEDSPDGVGYIDSREEYVLTSSSIH